MALWEGQAALLAVLVVLVGACCTMRSLSPFGGRHLRCRARGQTVWLEVSTSFSLDGWYALPPTLGYGEILEQLLDLP